MRGSPVFVVSTGRCGSTLISNALRLHPAVLSVSEFISSLGPHAFSGSVDVLTQVTEPDPHVGWLIRHELEYPEVLYPFGRGSFARSTGVPPLLTTTLPHLEPNVSEAEQLFRELTGSIGAQLEDASPAEGYAAVFEWLRRRYEADVWVERSGGSLRLLPKILAAFPTARFVHIYRDGWATAQSMSRHNGFRLAILVRKLTARLGLDPFLDPVRDWSAEAEQLDPSLRRLLPDRFSASAFTDHDWRVRDFALLWSGLVSTGVKTLSELPEDRVLHLHYETVLRQPEAEMERLGTFVVGRADPSWVHAASTLVDPPRRSRPSDHDSKPTAAQRWLQGGEDALAGHRLLEQDDPSMSRATRSS